MWDVKTITNNWLGQWIIMQSKEKYLNSKLALSMDIYTYVCMHVGMYA